MGIIMQKGALIKRKQLKNLLLFIVGVIVINLLSSQLSYRIDLTKDQRYTLAQPTKKLLKSLDGYVHIKVYLKGQNLPASFRHFSSATKDLLEDFNRISNGHLRFEFINPLAGLTNSEKSKVADSLAHLGIMPFNIRAQSDATDGVTSQIIFPSALIDYKGHKLGINLLQQQPGSNPEQSLNYATSLLEYKFALAISRLSKGKPPRVAYLLGNGETLNPSVYDALSILNHQYRMDTLNLKRTASIPLKYSAIVILDPSTAFSKKEKIKIDQYVMQGGKILWGIHPTHASMDSLQVQSSFLAYDKDLNLNDLLFTYGIRINPDILQDLQCFSIPITVGKVGNHPQIKRLPWVYEPLLNPITNHPITNNLDLILSSFPGSIDTTHLKRIKKTILLSTSAHSRSLSTPRRISLDDIKDKPNPRAYTSKNLPVAVLLEGQFSSVFKNRLNSTTLSNIAIHSGKPFKSKSSSTKMIVVSDPNIFKNQISQKEGPLPMGMDRYTRQTFSNQDFFKNCLTYLTDTTNIMLARKKEFSANLLDKVKVKKHKNLWTVLDFLLPFLFVLLFGLIFQYVRKRRFIE